ncbi:MULTISPECIES: metal ABC transporter ATP-binding protein [Cobetia]|jgi:zinc transport system ATP-binding protein|uniref:Metal ABC transporter ATP-binding protein n=1 Tax=Cobetia marina TaxID=28258 RepID=A0ABU9GAI5_COBMA|nr:MULTISPECIES: metal ABC transporter ATP-binding protein [Cobetia]AZV31330.1 metal ABC transporter ATP-binding protein [Cobetia sp. ICG0124]MDH2289728.1 metal ABC transporter ATP-binding protein [Cobetia sp. 10Alg 146]
MASPISVARRRPDSHPDAPATGRSVGPVFRPVPADAPDAIDIRGVTFRYGEQVILDDVDFQVGAREIVGLIGPNGGGKSTLLKLVLGLHKPAAGCVRVLGRTPQSAARHIGYVPQFANFVKRFPIRVEDVVLMGRQGRKRQWGPWPRADREAIGAVLEEVGIGHLRRRHIDALSGGQLQRVLIARALAAEPQLLLLDEPTASVDSDGERSLFELFNRLANRMSVVVISHDLGFISDYVDRVACLNRKMIVHDTETLTAESIERLYGEHVQMIHHHH